MIHVVLHLIQSAIDVWFYMFKSLDIHVIYTTLLIISCISF